MRSLAPFDPKMLRELKGLVFDIQKFCVHDGPGIRTVVFFKGCNLRCSWCQNPESISPEPEIAHSRVQCIQCGFCLKACPHNAITSSPEGFVRHRSLCQKCMACVQVCSTQALRTVGQWMTVGEVIKKVAEDSIFYENSKGGVTFSGGEPTLQFNFLKAVLEESGRRHFHRALETNGYLLWKRLLQLLPQLELILFDLKHLHSRVHERFTGAGNRLIRMNLERLAKQNKVNWIPRVPLIPELNDELKHLAHLGQWVKGLGAKEIHLLPYHRLGESKLGELGYPPENLIPGIRHPSEEEVEKAGQVLRQAGLTVIIGG
jgi:pyruvate formate lyase activating enzyme